MANFIMGVISLTIGVVVLSAVFISTVQNSNQSYACLYPNGSTGNLCGWTTAEIALWGLITLVGIAGILYGAMNVFGMS